MTAVRVQALAVETFRTLELAGLGRVDFFLSRADGALYVNEVNSLPASTAVSIIEDGRLRAVTKSAETR